MKRETIIQQIEGNNSDTKAIKAVGHWSPNAKHMASLNFETTVN